MTDDEGQRASPTDDQIGRRHVLAGVAATAGVAIAGCSLPSRFKDDTASSATFTASEAKDVLSSSTPTVEWPAPVQPEASALADAVDRIDELLADVPDSLGPDDIPNGVVRAAIEDRRDAAVSSRDEAAAASEEMRYHTLRDVRSGRESARVSRTTLLAIDEDVAALVDELEAEHEAVQSAVRNRLDGIDYRGVDTADGRLRAALYYQQLESDLARDERVLDRWSVDSDQNVIEIGEAAGDLEFATATMAVWDHLAAQYESEIDDSVDLEPVFADALDRSLDRAEDIDFPAQDGNKWYDAVGIGDLDDGRLEHAVWQAGRSVTDAHEDMEAERAEGNLGTGLYRAVQFEQAVRAFDRFRDRIVDGTVAPPETVAAIRDERDRAIDAAAATREEIPVSEPSIGAYVLGETLQTLEWADESVRRAADNDPETVVSLPREYTEYARIRAKLEVLPDAVDAFRDRLLAE